jgi:hypothetical protein
MLDGRCSMATIEDIILVNDQRGVAHLRPYLPRDFCDKAADFVLSLSGTVVIATGFYITPPGAPESDGPPGALALGRALESLGWRIVYVSDSYTVPLLRPFVEAGTEVVDFPITDDESSGRFASDLLSRLEPSLLISIERCGLTQDGKYLNMRAVDVTAQTAKLDYLFLEHPNTIGIGDGGNEIGMGNVAEHVPEIESMPSLPAVTRTSHLIISSTSNWGGYGLVAALSIRVGRDLLPSTEDEAGLIRSMVDLGAVDGVKTAHQYSVDGMDIEEHGQALNRLRTLLAEKKVSA